MSADEPTMTIFLIGSASEASENIFRASRHV